VSVPTLQPAGADFQLLLVPYRAGTQMGEHLPPFKDQLTSGRWALISHGDWSGGLRGASMDEPGVYMPLTRGDLTAYRPAAVLLGHIHAPYDGASVHHAGSPAPLDVNETGLRRFLVFDTETLAITSRQVDSPRIYYNETVVMLPVDDEPAYLREQLRRRMADWGLPKGWQDRVQVRLRIVGYSADRGAVEAAARQALSAFTLLDDGPDLSDLNHTQDFDRNEIAQQVKSWIETLVWKWTPEQPSRDDILREALAVIYAA
jgi:hypothetical protein